MPSPYADLVARHGLAASHRLLLAAVPPGGRVLDVGCATGYLAEPLTAAGCEVTGLEADPVAASRAEAVCARVIVGDVEDPATRARLPEDQDAIVIGDVLEHLRDPWSTVAALAGLLSPSGRIVASVPNIGWWSARRQVARGRFPYTDHGVFDRTHLRFFTRSSAHELARTAGLDVIGERFAPGGLPGEPALRRALGHSESDPPAWVVRLRDRAAAARPELFALQVVITCVPRARD